jgi:hypothetical protein
MSATAESERATERAERGRERETSKDGARARAPRRRARRERRQTIHGRGHPAANMDVSVERRACFVDTETASCGLELSKGGFRLQRTEARASKGVRENREPARGTGRERRKASMSWRTRRTRRVSIERCARIVNARWVSTDACPACMRSRKADHARERGHERCGVSTCVERARASKDEAHET